MRLTLPSARIFRRCLGCLFIILSFLSSSLYAQTPPWWSTYQVLNTSATADDYTAANQGQAKNIASKARNYLNAELPGGAGTSINNMVNGWATPISSTDNYTALNLGQLKSIAQPFYDRLNAAGHSITPPWTASPTDGDDFSLVNLGQLKNAFAFSFPSLVANPQTLTAVEDTPKSIILTASGVGTLTYSIISSPDPAKGTISGTPPNVTFTPVANINGLGTSFVFQVTNGIASSTATVTISSINPVNDLPKADTQSITTTANTAKAITLTGSDIDGSALTYSVVVLPPSNTGTLSGSGSNLIFTPVTSYYGTTSFTFKVNDGTSDSAPATINIIVTDPNDSDGDGVSDFNELILGLNPASPYNGWVADLIVLEYGTTPSGWNTTWQSNPNDSTPPSITISSPSGATIIP